MSYGVIEYDVIGRPICEICGKSFHRVISHVRQVHMMSEREYKLSNGFDLKKGICSKESKDKSSEATLLNFDKCIKKNLIEKGKKSRFNVGHQGRIADMVQEQTRLRLKKRLKEPSMILAMQKSGYIVGKSGLGNKTRWTDSLI